MLREFAPALAIIGRSSSSLPAILLLALVSNGADAEQGVTDPSPGVIGQIAIDVDVTGNTMGGAPWGDPPSVQGPLDSCRVVDAGSTFSVDVVIDEILEDAEGSEVGVLSVGVPVGFAVTSVELAEGAMYEFDNFFGYGHLFYWNSTPWHGEITLARLTVSAPAAGAGDLTPIDRSGEWLGVVILPVASITGATVVASDLTDGCGDDDSDGVYNAVDNCASVANGLQENIDGDSLGDVCDPDADNDGVPNDADNCDFLANPGQEDFDGDGFGTACEPVDVIAVDTDISGNSADTVGAIDSCNLISSRAPRSMSTSSSKASRRMATPETPPAGSPRFSSSSTTIRPR